MEKELDTPNSVKDNPTNKQTNKQTNKAHCLFEQSGTFKNEFKKLGYEAYDYDILNDYGETDYQIDLFKEIDNAYEGRASIFDNITPDDTVIAFFPCTRFEAQILLTFWQKGSQHKKLPLITKLERDLTLQDELTHNYKLITKMVIVCVKRKLKLIIENPWSKQHYLTTHWCIEPKIIDMDRRKDGDAYKKPTQYYFINCEPKNNLVFEPIDYVEPKIMSGRTQRQRSEITPNYASRFIRKYIV